jgi:hypothetical protein
VLGLGHNDGRLMPEKIASLEGITISRVACGWDHCLALDAQGKVLSWGSGQNGKPETRMILFGYLFYRQIGTRRRRKYCCALLHTHPRKHQNEVYFCGM